MTASLPGSAARPEDPEHTGDDDLQGETPSSPEEARAAAEDTLAQVEALADVDEDPDAPAPSESDVEDPDSSSNTTAGTGTLEDQCENCGVFLHGPYCSQCGQKAADGIVPVWHMVNESLEAVFELDLRVLHTLPTFLFRPGRLTKEYIGGGGFSWST